MPLNYFIVTTFITSVILNFITTLFTELLSYLIRFFKPYFYNSPSLFIYYIGVSTEY